MTAINFCYWLQGFFEINTVTQIEEWQAKIIQKHLSLVFEHDIDPKAGDKSIQDKLNVIHSPNDPDVRVRC